MPGRDGKGKHIMSNDRAPQVKTAHVFCNGELKNPERAGSLAASSDLVIATDGGAQHLAALGLKPEVIVGDMDSTDADTWRGDDGVTLVPYPSDKDRSDTELAVEYALAHGCQQVSLLAAVGKRLDHTLGNIALVARYAGRVAILDGNVTLVAVNKSEKCMLHGSVGTTVSLIPYGAERATVRTQGLKYPLENESLAFATHGLSNQLSQTEACLCISEGILFVCIDNQAGGLDS